VEIYLMHRALRLMVAGCVSAAIAVLAACGNGGPSVEPTSRLIGTITHRERVALPPGSTLEIRLEDAADARTVASETMQTADRQVPIPFTLEFERDALQPDREYVVRAAIRAPSGEVLFSTPADQQPLENPNTTGRVELEVAAVGGGSNLR
jgi:uncharacterized lipoprotein YbaY